ARAVAQNRLRTGEAKATPAKPRRPMPAGTDAPAAREPRRTLSDRLDRTDRSDRSHASRKADESRQRPSSRLTETFRIFAPCPQGLEEVLCEEMQALGFEHVEKGRAGCAFETNWTGILRANLYSRLATRILVQVGHGLVLKVDDIYELTYDTPD